MMTEKIAGLKWWQVALVTLVVSGLGRLSVGKTEPKRIALYEKKNKQAAWAPPGWVFGPVWAVNNFFVLQALKNLLTSANPDKKKLLSLQALIWGVFFTFGPVYFRKKSPILAAVWTMVDAALALSSFLIARKSDKKMAMNYLPLLGWTVFASSVADFQALKNPDPMFNSKALLN